MTDSTPSITIPGVPETITRAQYVALIESVGFKPNDLASLRFTVEGIYAEVFARNADGARIIDHSAADNDDGSVATVKHSVFIRVEDAEVEA